MHLFVFCLFLFDWLGQAISTLQLPGKAAVCVLLSGIVALRDRAQHGMTGF